MRYGSGAQLLLWRGFRGVVGLKLKVKCRLRVFIFYTFEMEDKQAK